MLKILPLNNEFAIAPHGAIGISLSVYANGTQSDEGVLSSLPNN